MEKEQLYRAKTLVSEWQTLEHQVEIEGAFDYPLFKKVFEDTYRVLKPISIEFMIDKQIMPLIMQAQSFVKSKVASVSAEHSAAVVMSERMLHLCVTKPSPSTEPVEGTMIYVLETRQEIYINFNDVETAMETLAENFRRD